MSIRFSQGRLFTGIHIEEEAEEEEVDTSLRGRLLSLVDKIKSLRKKDEEEKPEVEEEPKPSKKKKSQVKILNRTCPLESTLHPRQHSSNIAADHFCTSPNKGTLQELISHTMIHWAQESFIQNPELVRLMFSLLHRQYDGLGELIRALPKAYAINAVSVQDTMDLLECLGQIRSLLIVQMGPEEERLMIQSIGCVERDFLFYSAFSNCWANEYIPICFLGTS